MSEHEIKTEPEIKGVHVREMKYLDYLTVLKKLKPNQDIMCTNTTLKKEKNIFYSYNPYDFQQSDPIVAVIYC